MPIPLWILDYIFIIKANRAIAFGMRYTAPRKQQLIIPTTLIQSYVYPRLPLLLLTAFVCCQYTEAATFDRSSRSYRGTRRTINDLREERMLQKRLQKEAELRAAEQEAERAEREAERKRQEELREEEEERLRESRERWEADNSYAEARTSLRKMKSRYDIPENGQSIDLKRETYLFTEKRYAEAYSKLDPNNKKAYEKFLRRMEKEWHVKRMPAGANFLISWVYQDGVERPELYSIYEHEDFESINEKELARYQQELDKAALNIVCEVEFPGDEEEGYIS